MDIKSINEYTKIDEDLELFDLTTPSFIWRNDLKLSEYTVEKKHEKRIDLLFQDIYNIESNEVGVHLENIDILLHINNIDNPLSLKKGLVILVPSFKDFDKYRYKLSELESEKTNIRERLVVPNKSTRKDVSRQKFKENNYSLSPVILNEPRRPVRITNSRFSIGGL